MSIVRFTTIGILLLVLSQVFAGCAARMPRGAVTSDQGCQDDYECNAWDPPECYSNIQQCYNGHCLMRKISGCIPAVALPAGAVAVPSN
jgi:hypothetical protein